MIEKETGGAYVHSLKIGHNIIDDTMDGFLMPANKQVDWACDLIGNDTKLKVMNVFSRHYLNKCYNYIKSYNCLMCMIFIFNIYISNDVALEI